MLVFEDLDQLKDSMATILALEYWFLEASA
jgi:hypothetical protein